MTNICPDCGETIKGNPNFHAKKHASSVAVMEPRSRRGQERQRVTVLTPLEQIRKIPNSGADDSTGAWCYYIRPGGATLRDVLGLSPNGGVPENASPKMRGRYGMNSELYRQKLRNKGYIPIGSKLDQNAVRMVVKEMAKNREEAIWEMEDEIAECDRVITENADPRWTPTYKRRKQAALKRKATLEAPFDGDALVAQLDEISRAQRMASVPEATMQVFREMIGEANDKMVAYFAQNTGKNKGDSGESFTGQDFIDAD